MTAIVHRTVTACGGQTGLAGTFWTEFSASAELLKILVAEMTVTEHYYPMTVLE